MTDQHSSTVTESAPAPPREYLKIKYMASPECCKCGDCHLVPPGQLLAWDRERDALVKALEDIKGGCFEGAVTLAVNGEWKAMVEKLQSIARAALSQVRP